MDPTQDLLAVHERLGYHDAKIEGLESKFDDFREWRHGTVSPMLTIIFYGRIALPAGLGFAGGVAAVLVMRWFGFL